MKKKSIFFFQNIKNKLGTPFKTIDKVITGLIIGSAVSGLLFYGSTKINTKKNDKNKINNKGAGLFRKVYIVFGKTLVFGLQLFNKKKK